MTDKPKHTPGPWTLYSNSPDADGSESLPSIMAANPLGDGLFYVAQANLDADAHLIAAAPDLLAVLRKAEDAIGVALIYAETQPKDEADESVEDMLRIAQSECRAAIARAESTS